MIAVYMGSSQNTYNLMFSRAVRYSGIILVISSLLGMLFGENVLGNVLGVIFIALTSLLSCNKKYLSSPFAHLHYLNTLFFFNIPIAFITFMGSEYSFELGLKPTFSQQNLFDAYVWALPFLFVCWFSVWIAIVTSKSVMVKEINILKKSGLLQLALLGVIVIAVNSIQIAAFKLSWVDQGGISLNPLLGYLFLDVSYILLVGIIVLTRINQKRVNDRGGYTAFFLVVYIAFVALSIVAGSKAGFLTNLMFIYFLPCCLFGLKRRVFRTPVENIVVWVSALLCALIVFYFLNLVRSQFGGRLTASNAIDYFNQNFNIYRYQELDESIKAMFYRLSWGGLDRFVIIFKSFVIDGPDFETTSRFLSYIAKNLINLLLPGTYYSDCIAPSSQIFSQVTQKDVIGLNFDGVDSLTRSLNTQPYTIYGFFSVLCGIFSPFLMFFFTKTLILIFNWARHFYGKLFVLTLFMLSLSCFGIEVVVADSMHILISFLFMYSLLNFFCSINDEIKNKTLGNNSN